MYATISNDLESLINAGSRLFLINAPAIDFRLPWFRWHQPIGLIKVGTYLRNHGCDVRLIDCLQPTNDRLPRKKVGRVKVDGYQVDLWRFGLSSAKLISQLRDWEMHGWVPDAILISCGMSFWWQGTKDLIEHIRSVSRAPIVLGGSYPTFYSEHAAQNAGADALFVGDVHEANRVVPDLNIYSPGQLPRFAGIYLINPSGVMALSASPRNPQEIADEVQEKARLGVTTFAFFDPWLGPEHRQPLANTLALITARQIPKIRFIAPGNFSPRLVNRDLAALLKQVSFKHIYLHDDIFHTPTHIKHLSSLDDYQKCMNALKDAGFQTRTDEVGAAVVLGLPGENLENLTEWVIRLSSIVGSIHLVPFQFTPGTAEGKAYERWLAQRNGRFEPDMLNGKTFPLSRLAGASYEDYLEITRLVALLNNKFHSRTFDFLGSGLTAQLVRKSLQDQLWNPFSTTTRAGKREDFIPLPIKEDM